MAVLTYTAATTLAHVRSNFRALQTFMENAQADGANLAAAAALRSINLGARSVQASHIESATIAANRLKRRLIVPRLLPAADLEDDRFDWANLYALRSPEPGQVYAFGGKIATLASGDASGQIIIYFNLGDTPDAGIQETITTPLRCIWDVSAETAPPCAGRQVVFGMIGSQVTSSAIFVNWVTADFGALTTDWDVTVNYHLIAGT